MAADSSPCPLLHSSLRIITFFFSEWTLFITKETLLITFNFRIIKRLRWSLINKSITLRINLFDLITVYRCIFRHDQNLVIVVYFYQLLKILNCRNEVFTVIYLLKYRLYTEFKATWKEYSFLW